MAQHTDQAPRAPGKNRRRTAIWAVAVLILTGVGLALYANWDDLTEGKFSSQESRALEYELKDAAGKVHRLSELKGQPVLVHFWATWCPPCLDELPEFLEMVKRSEGRKIHFVAITLDKSWEDAHKILPTKDLPVNLVSLIDPEATSADTFGSYNYPETYALDRELKIIEKFVGPRPWGSEEFKDLPENLEKYRGR